MHRRFALALAVAVVTLTACGTSHSPMAASSESEDEFTPAAKAAGGVDSGGATSIASEGGVVTPTRQFMFVWGTITVNGVPAPAGTVVAAVDKAGNAAGQFTVWYPGYYGAMAVYLDDPATPLDEGASPGELLSIRVNGSTPSKFRWTRFGDVLRVDVRVVVPITPKGGPSPLPIVTGEGGGAGTLPIVTSEGTAGSTSPMKKK